MKKIEVDLSKFPNAVCNDGSPAAYYYKPALSNVGHENIWNVHFEGGNWCTDEESCDFRSRLTRYNAKKIADGVSQKMPSCCFYTFLSKPYPVQLMALNVVRNLTLSDSHSVVCGALCLSMMCL
jgi:hypothetical protein